MLLSVLSLVPFFVARSIFYEESHEKLIALSVVTLLWHALTLFVSNLAVVKIGMIVAENSVLRMGNDSILDSYRERITIIEEKSNRVLYCNSAEAKNSSLSNLLQDLDAPNFIMIEKDVFEGATADSYKVLKNIKETSKLYSVSQIIELGKANKKKLDRCIFKLPSKEDSIEGIPEL